MAAAAGCMNAKALRLSVSALLTERTHVHAPAQTAALVWFILCGFFVSSFVLNFVVSLVLLALDFWTVSANCHAALVPPAVQISLLHVARMRCCLQLCDLLHVLHTYAGEKRDRAEACRAAVVE